MFKWLYFSLSSSELHAETINRLWVWERRGVTSCWAAAGLHSSNLQLVFKRDKQKNTRQTKIWWAPHLHVSPPKEINNAWPVAWTTSRTQSDFFSAGSLSVVITVTRPAEIWMRRIFSVLQDKDWCRNLGHSLTPCWHHVIAAQLLLIQLGARRRSQCGSFRCRRCQKSAWRDEGRSEKRRANDCKRVVPHSLDQSGTNMSPCFQLQSARLSSRQAASIWRAEQRAREGSFVKCQEINDVWRRRSRFSSLFQSDVSLFSRQGSFLLPKTVLTHQRGRKEISILISTILHVSPWTENISRTNKDNFCPSVWEGAISFASWEKQHYSPAGCIEVKDVGGLVLRWRQIKTLPAILM